MAPSPPTTLPASWYTTPALLSLETRAVFHRAWYLLGPVVKFQQDIPITYEFANIPLIALRTTPATINVTSPISANPLRAHTTSTGLLFTTITPLAPPFEEFFPGLEDLLRTVDFTTRPHRRSLDYEGAFNWKTMVDGYQECLHCAYTHPSFSALYPPTSYAVTNHTNWSQHFADPAKPADGLFLYFFPNCTLNVYGGGMSLFRVCPTEEVGRTRMEFDYFNVEGGEGFEEYFRFVRQVAREDYELCERVQANLEKGVYAEGVLNPAKETGVVYYQQRVLEMVLEQHRREKTARVSEVGAVETEVGQGDWQSRLGGQVVEAA